MGADEREKFLFRRYSGYSGKILNKIQQHAVRISALFKGYRDLAISFVFLHWMPLSVVTTLAAIAVLLRAFAPPNVLQLEFWVQNPDDVRTLTFVFVSIGGAVFASIGLYFARERSIAASTQARTVQENHFTDLMVRSAEQLVHTEPVVRLVGLHSLVRVARHSKQDREAVLDILIQYARSNLPTIQPSSSADVTNFYGVTNAFEGRQDTISVVDSISVLSYLVDADEREYHINQLAFPPEHAPTNGFSSIKLKNCTFFTTDFSGFLFEECKLDAVFFNDCRFNLSWFNWCIIDRCNLTGSQFPTAHFHNTSWNGGIYLKTYFGRSFFNACFFMDVRFEECDFHHCDFEGARFGNTQFIGCDVSGAFFGGVDGLIQSAFRNCLYHIDNPPTLPDGIDIDNSKSFVSHTAKRGTLETW